MSEKRPPAGRSGQLGTHVLRNETEGFISRATHVLDAAQSTPAPSSRTLCAVVEYFEPIKLPRPWYRDFVDRSSRSEHESLDLGSDWELLSALRTLNGNVLVMVG